jgi:hypothetical protein
MAHLLILRIANSVPGRETIGVHEKIEAGIAARKYPVEKKRKGYNTPIASEWRFLDYRIKLDVVEDFCSDLNPVLLNPTPNNITLAKIFLPSKQKSMTKQERNQMKHNRQYSIGKTFLIIQWLFKWLNNKKVTTRIFMGIIISPLIIMSLLGLLFGGLVGILSAIVGLMFTIVLAVILLPVVLLVKTNPIKPVPRFDLTYREPFVPSYNYNICLGMLADPPEVDRKTGRVYQEDVL